ncbi:alpha-ketoglutarate-dependent dioxygenase AlkB [Flavobacterium sp. MAH-1]|uniref:Alpha-ketoglutarate-dependent dioxygenase AlkB n=1 Tax=Flavobacterium agri TaxID=2743471 RepID=A0A7Y8Y3L0_9FLAO|nr:alpha-ketoglutarate-dependent dioxygenase AlkB [Flavobacterium agri]NUY81924.1 alpha-ketoglutarate-dependent dioxygenase AlkB [Flavobacterium agri]NYA71948.1 alpha-ketoglutarate-dependent dioxygenase AlkB [Flavobacterium agri]
MTLFNDTDLFASGTDHYKEFDLPDAEVTLRDAFFTKEEADFYYDILLNQTPWREFEMEIYDKTVKVPRMVAWYEDKENSGAAPDALEWTPALLEIRKRVEENTGVKFNSVLLNLYRNGRDGVSWHSDREYTIGKDPTIASVTFGETRMFRLRHKVRKDIPQVEIPLHHGSFLLMSGTTNTYWQHEVPKTARKVLPRINLTFRIAKRLP